MPSLDVKGAAAMTTMHNCRDPPGPEAVTLQMAAAACATTERPGVAAVAAPRINPAVDI